MCHQLYKGVEHKNQDQDNGTSKTVCARANAAGRYKEKDFCFSRIGFDSKAAVCSASGSNAVTLSYESRHINRGIRSWKEANTAEEAEEAEQPLKSHSIDYKYRLSRPPNS